MYSVVYTGMYTGMYIGMYSVLIANLVMYMLNLLSTSKIKPGQKSSWRDLILVLLKILHRLDTIKIIRIFVS